MINHGRRPAVRVRPAVGGLLALLALLVGCAPAARLAPGTVLFAGSMQELMPLHDGDWWLYRSTGGGREPRLELSRVSRLPEADDVLVTYSESQAVLGRVRLRPTADAIAVVSEIDTAGGIGLLYLTPVPLFVAPVTTGVRRASSAVEIWRLSDKVVIGTGRAEYSFQALPDAHGEIAVRVKRTLTVAERRNDVSHTIWLRPGVGEVRGAGGDGDTATQRELLCAEVGGAKVGTCPAQ